MIDKKILFLVPTLRRGGAETQLVTLVNNLSPRKFQKHLVSFDQGLDQRDKLDSSVIFHHFLRVGKYDINAIRAIAQLIDKEHIDIVHCTLQIALFFGWAAIRFSSRKPKLIVAVHTTLNVDFRSELFDWLLYQWLMRGCDSIIFVCKEQLKHWGRKWRFIQRKGCLIYNGIDPVFFSKKAVIDDAADFRNRHRIPEGAQIIAHIAGFRPEKGHETIVDAFAQCVAKSPDAILVFAGDGVLRNRIETLVAERQLTKHVRFIGNVSDVRPLLANSAISVIASTSETFSIAMLESMAMEVPLVAFDIGGTREAVIPQKTGWLVPSGNIVGLANTLSTAIANTDERKYLAHAARQYILENFTVEKMTAVTEQLFTSIGEGLPDEGVNAL